MWRERAIKQMDERKPVENQLDGLDSEIISSIEDSPPIRQHFCC
jgi:hypothetical protein